MKKFLLFFAFLVTIQSLLAQTDIEVDGIFYRINSDMTARVIKPDTITYSGVIKIPAQIDYRGRLYNVDCRYLESALKNSAVTELYLAEGIKVAYVRFNDVTTLKKIVIPSTLPEYMGEYDSKFAFLRSENAVSFYVVDYGENVKIRVEKFNVYDTDGKKLTPYVYDCYVDKKYYPDENGLIGPFDKTSGNTVMTGCSSFTTAKISSNWCTLLCCDVKGTRACIRGEGPFVTTGNKFFSGGLRYDILPDEKAVCVSRDVSLQHSGNIIIPANVSYGGKNYPVESIGSWAFMNSDISSVTFPQSMKYIGDPDPNYNKRYSLACFDSCKNLKEINFNEGLISIGGFSFCNCIALETVNLPMSLQIIGNGTFSSCSSLKKLVIQGNRTKLIGNTFGYCENLKAIFLFSERPLEAENCFSEITYKNAVLYVPTGTKELYEYHPEWKKFRYIEEFNPADIDKIDIDKMDNYITEVDGLKYRCHSDNNTATLIGYDDSKIKKYLKLPESVHLKYDNKDYPVASVGIGAFAYSEVLEGIDLSTVTEIESDAFYQCATLFNVEMPNVEIIGKNAFGSIETLERVAMNKVKNVGSGAFSYCGNLSEIIMPVVEVIEPSAFSNCTNIENINAPKVRELGYSAFQNCNRLTKVDMPQLTRIGHKAFEGAFSYDSGDQIEVKTPNVISIGKNAFSGCCKNYYYNGYGRMSALYFPKLESIESDAFYNTQISSLMLGPLSEINTGYLPAYLYIDADKYNGQVYGFDIFLASENVPNIWEEGQKELFSEDCYGHCALIVPLGCADAYRQDLHEDKNGKQYGWGRFKTIREVDFTDMLAKIEVPLEEKTHRAMIDGLWYTVNDEDNTASVDSLSSESMAHVLVPEKISAYTRDYRVTRISEGAFSGTRIESIEMNNIESIGANAFEFCSNLKKVEAAKAIEIGERAFSVCTALENINIEKVESIGQWVFMGCGNLKRIIANNAKEIEDNAFNNSNIEYLEINNAKWLGFCAVEGVKNVYVLSHFPPYMEPLGDYYFNDYATLYVPAGRKAVYESDPEWGRYANIVEVGVSGVDNVSVGRTPLRAGYYDLHGIRHDAPQPGFNILIDDEGKVEKRMYR